MKTTIGISEKARVEVSSILNTLLGSEFALYVKTRQFHWNVQGKNFVQLHKFFEEQYEALDEVVDQVAERVRALGEFPLGSMQSFLEKSLIKENKKNSLSDSDMLGQLLEDQEVLVRFIRDNLSAIESSKDQATEDFLVGLMADHEKSAWMLRAQLK